MTPDGESQDATPNSPLNTKTSEEMYEIGANLCEEDKYDEAIVVLKRSDPNNLSVQYVLGNCYFETENYAEALKCFSKIIEANPNHPEITIVLKQCALCCMLQDKWHEAINYLEKAHKRKERDLQTLTHYGICLYKIEKYDKASVFLNTALNIDRRNHLASKYLGKIAVLRKSSELGLRH